MKTFRLGSRRNVPGEDAQSGSAGEPAVNTGIPISIYAGRTPNPHHLWGTGDMENKPVTYARYNMSRGVHDVQLSNGWQFTNYGQVTTYATSGYLNAIQPQIPGQSRLIGGSSPTAYVPRGGSPAQWQTKVDLANNAASTTGGPGILAGTLAASAARSNG